MYQKTIPRNVISSNVMSSNVRITETTTTTVSVVVINIGYCKSKLGLLKVILLLLSITAFALLSSRHRFVRGNSEFSFLYMINYSHLYALTLMFLACLLSLRTSTLLPKLTFDFVFHFSAALLYLIAGLWTISDALDWRSRPLEFASILAFVISLVHAIHGYFSFTSARLN